jgi:hypothetical protein
MDGYNVEIEEIDQQHVVLVIRASRLIVLGRTFDEAQQLATAAIAWRRQDGTKSWGQPATGPTSDEAIETVSEVRDAFRAA